MAIVFVYSNLSKSSEHIAFKPFHIETFVHDSRTLRKLNFIQMKNRLTFLLLLGSVCSFAETNVKNHVVVPNQTLYAIGRLYKVSPQELMSLNPQYGPSYLLVVGNVVKVPVQNEVQPIASNVPVSNPVKTTTEVAAVAVPKAVPAAVSAPRVVASAIAPPKVDPKPASPKNVFLKFQTHEVKPGETIESIAAKEGVALTDLLAYNKAKPGPLKEGDKVYVKGVWVAMDNSKPQLSNPISFEGPINTASTSQSKSEVVPFNESR